MFQCFVAKFLTTNIYSLASEKQNITLVLLTLSAAICNERMCLYCWTEFLTGVLVHIHPYCLCVDLSARKSLEAGRWFQSNRKWSQLTRFQLGFQFACLLSPHTLPLPCSVPPSTRHRNCAWCCDTRRWSEQLSPSHFHCNSSKGGEDEHCVPTSNSLFAWICPRPGTHRSGNHFTQK